MFMILVNSIEIIASNDNRRIKKKKIKLIDFMRMIIFNHGNFWSLSTGAIIIRHTMPPSVFCFGPMTAEPSSF